jgi:dienelactone hydrolase
MKLSRPILVALLLLSPALTLAPIAAAEIKPIERVLPPRGIETPKETRDKLQQQLDATKKRLEKHASHRLAPDVEIFTKAVDLALRFDEFYSPKDFDKAFAALKTANQRLDALDEGKSPWTRQTGLVVRGYRSAIDGSAQPYGVVIPKDHDFDRPTTAYLWLHGRGDKATDLHFLHERQNSRGQLPDINDAIVVHPFGRQCVGFKSAGEIDVLDVAAEAQKQYKVDPKRTVLIGFSMGGAGAWHLGAHYADHWCAVAPGAGFAETARYVRLKPENYPPEYEQKLWGAYDVPCYVRNLFNVPTIAYSGENDRQIQAARVMEEAFEAEGEKLKHLIGPGVEHKYEPKTLAQLLKMLDAIASRGKATEPRTVHLQTRTLRYPRYAWVEILGLGEHWKDSRVDAQLVTDTSLRVTTENVTALKLGLTRDQDLSIVIDGEKLEVPKATASATLQGLHLVRRDGKWQEGGLPKTELRKRHGLQGPIDDAFLAPFLVVVPSQKSEFAQEWIDFELAHFLDRWPALMRGEVRTIRDTELRPEHHEQFNLIVWGDPDSSSVLRELNGKLPVAWQEKTWTLGGKEYDRANRVPAFIYPNPKNPQRYIVVNSGLTFREAHDRTNSQQNPKLPDWAVIDTNQAPDANSPGKIEAAGFFDEEWKLKIEP